MSPQSFGNLGAGAALSARESAPTSAQRRPALNASASAPARGDFCPALKESELMSLVYLATLPSSFYTLTIPSESQRCHRQTPQHPRSSEKGKQGRGKLGMGALSHSLSSRYRNALPCLSLLLCSGRIHHITLK